MCETVAQGKELGTESKLRIITALDYIKANSSSNQAWNIFLGAGKQPGFPDAPTGKQLMLNFITQELVAKGYKIVGRAENPIVYVKFEKGSSCIKIRFSYKNAWGTFMETYSIILAFKSFLLGGMVHLFSSDYHLPRILYIWSFFPQFSVKTHGCKAKNPTPYLEWLRMIKVSLLGLFMKMGLI